MFGLWRVVNDNCMYQQAPYQISNIEESQDFSCDFRYKKQLTYKISKERRIAIASVVGLDNLSLNLWIIILRFIT